MANSTSYAVDSHVHVLDPARFPLSNPEGYVPQPNECGTAYDLRTTLDAHELTHALLVNPFAGYATDNRCMLDAIANSRGRFKGVALVGHDTDDATLRQLTDGGVIGARFNTLFTGSTSLQGEAGERLLRQIREHGWFAQIYYHHDGLQQLLPILRRTGVKIVVDHCGCPNPALGLDQSEFQALLELGRSGEALIKLSGAFRYSQQAWPYHDAEPYIEALIDAFTLDRCVWGSDWPFVRIPKRMDYGPTSGLLKRWIPDDNDRRKVLWETPKRHFGFTEK
ncbi:MULTISPECIES: amidohydrolase [unclassified Pigmentiphaga]|uniref:amidohydrolase family protein n=1 Tax=unclassified Pigmentiphaga TaxID=2626614 RepID=UPI000B41B085|nr:MULTISPECIES: amidohydrolase family protein [unclassified Pigmentiphaga]OVZ65177.1 hypothetical protein CDO46_07215 [Pigmentiphaga sp. NML030171]